MAANRVFLPQTALDEWLTDGRVDVAGDVMTLQPEGRRFKLKTALRFLAEVAEGGDESGLIGKVKDLDQLEALGGEHCSDSVILGDNAYEVIEGFVGEPIMTANKVAQERESLPAGDNLAAATMNAIGERPRNADLDLLAKLFLSSDRT